MTITRLLRGDKVRLTMLTRYDAPVIAQWYEDILFARLFDAMAARPRTTDGIERWIDRENNEETTFFFGIRPVEHDELVGIIDISGIEWTHGTGWLGIAIGDPSKRRRGYGYEAMRLMLDFAFRELNLHRIQLTVFSYNEAAIQLYKKLGFTFEGAQREALHRDNQRYDMHVYGILRHEWKAQA